MAFGELMTSYGHTGSHEGINSQTYVSISQQLVIVPSLSHLVGLDNLLEKSFVVVLRQREAED